MIKNTDNIKKVAKLLLNVALIVSMTFASIEHTSDLLIPKHRSMRVDSFYNLPENSLDVLFVGSSKYLRGISPNQIYLQTGISSYNRSSELIPAEIQYLYVVDSFKTQKPKVVFLSTSTLTGGFDEEWGEYYYYMSMNKVKYSEEKKEIAEAITREKIKGVGSAMSLLFPAIKYNDRKNSLLYRDKLTYSNINTRGQDPYWEVKKQLPGRENFTGKINANTNESFVFDATTKEYLDKTIEFCKQNGAQVVICDVPGREWTNVNYAAARSLAKEHDVVHLECMINKYYEKIDENTQIDWHDTRRHYNGWGAYNLNIFLGTFLNENFELADYRGQDKEITKSLDEDYKQYYYRYHMFLPKGLKTPGNYSLDNLANMNNIQVVEPNSSNKIYTSFENKLNRAKIKHTTDFIDVSGSNSISAKRYTLKSGVSIILAEYTYESDPWVLSVHNKELDFGESGKFPIVDPANETGFIMALEGTKTKDQAIKLINIYNDL